jgi:hypothetical protein
MRHLLDRRRRAVRNLPPLEEVLRGSVVVRTLRCGKPLCHCATGEGHRATYLSVTFPGGRTEQISLPTRLVPLARRWVANYTRWWNAVERISAINRQLLRQRRAAAAAPRRRRTGAVPRR